MVDSLQSKSESFSVIDIRLWPHSLFCALLPDAIDRGQTRPKGRFGSGRITPAIRAIAIFLKKNPYIPALLSDFGLEQITRTHAAPV